MSEEREYPGLLREAKSAEVRLRQAAASATEPAALSDLDYYNESCARCGVPCCLHTTPPRGYGVNGWPPACAEYKRCEPRRAAYGVLGGPC